MAITITSREFNQRASQALKMAETQQIFITRWGKVVGVSSRLPTTANWSGKRF